MQNTQPTNSNCSEQSLSPIGWKELTSNLVKPNLGHLNVNPGISVLYPNLLPTKSSGKLISFFLLGELTFNRLSPRTCPTYFEK